METFLSFKLEDSFIAGYESKEVSWGFGVLSELTFVRTYSRLKPGGGKERWYETVRRVVEGCYSIQKDHCESFRLPWDEDKAVSSAQEMYDRMFTFKIWAPGRGLEYLGTEVVNGFRDSSWLFNCSAVSTDDIKDNPVYPFTKAMHMLMHGLSRPFFLTALPVVPLALEVVHRQD